MKKFVAVISIVLLAMVSIFASPLPFALDLDFDLDYLVDNDFDLELDDHGMIIVSPPDWHWEERDLIVEEFSMIDTSEYGDWFIAMASFEDYATYEDIYNYIADEIGEDGYDAQSTIDFINLFYTEPTEDDLAELLLDGQLGEFLGDAIPAQMIIQIIEQSGAELQYINMWLYDDITIYTFMANGVGFAIYSNNEEVYDIIDTELGLAFLEELL